MKNADILQNPSDPYIISLKSAIEAANPVQVTKALKTLFNHTKLHEFYKTLEQLIEKTETSTAKIIAEFLLSTYRKPRDVLLDAITCDQTRIVKLILENGSDAFKANDFDEAFLNAFCPPHLSQKNGDLAKFLLDQHPKDISSPTVNRALIDIHHFQKSSLLSDITRSLLDRMDQRCDKKNEGGNSPSWKGRLANRSSENQGQQGAFSGGK